MAVISENIVEMKAEISLNENMVYIVKNGQIHLSSHQSVGMENKLLYG